MEDLESFEMSSDESQPMSQSWKPNSYDWNFESDETNPEIILAAPVHIRVEEENDVADPQGQENNIVSDAESGIAGGLDEENEVDVPIIPGDVEDFANNELELEEGDPGDEEVEMEEQLNEEQMVPKALMDDINQEGPGTEESPQSGFGLAVCIGMPIGWKTGINSIWSWMTGVLNLHRSKTRKSIMHCSMTMTRRMKIQKKILEIRVLTMTAQAT